MPEEDLEMKYRNKYNTKLTKYEEQEYKKDMGSESIARGRDITMDEGAYDVRGAWLEKGQSGTLFRPGHGTDRYKKPNHPTFSNESKYATKKNPGGSWLIKDTFVVPKTNMLLGKGLQRYFDQAEPTTKIVEVK